MDKISKYRCTKMKHSTCLISGIPRGGTSLLISMLSKDRKNIGLSEPFFLRKVKHASPNKASLVRNITSAINNLHKDIVKGAPILVRVGKDGDKLPNNYFRRVKKDGEIVVEKQSKHIKKTYNVNSETYKLFVKNNLLFMSSVEILSQHFETLLIVREPVATICSWNSLNLPISRGKVKSGFKYSSSLIKMVTSSNLLERQLQIYEWFCYKVRSVQKQVHLIKYEDLVSAPSSTLFNCSKHFQLKDLPPLKSRNTSVYYSDALRKKIIAMIDKGSYPNLSFFYPQTTGIVLNN